MNIYKKILIVLTIASLTFCKQSAAVDGLITEKIKYTSSDATKLVGHLAWDKRYSEKRPGILVVHEWWGLNDYAKQRANQLALMGYTVLAVDMFGDGKVTEHPETAQEFYKAVMSDFTKAEQRFVAAMETLKKHETVSAGSVSAIGYCFGGSIVLNMARLGLDLKGVASFHGGLLPAVDVDNQQDKQKITAKIRVYTGEDDSNIPPKQVASFKREMNQAGVNYRVISYPDTVHSFTNPGATAIGKKNNTENIRYNRYADTDSWARLSQFLSDLYR